MLTNYDKHFRCVKWTKILLREVLFILFLMPYFIKMLKILFTKDLPESIHDHLPTDDSFFNLNCNECGHICCFADNSTLTVSHHNVVVLEEKIAEKYQCVAEFMANNRLKLNSDKTHMIIMTSEYKHKRHKGLS